MRCVSNDRNPLLPGLGVCDPHIHIFEDRAYLYAGHDDPHPGGDYSMRDWQIWSSDDLVRWRQESVIDPRETFMGPSRACWATDAAEKDGHYYFYFSNGNTQTGVMTSERPGSGFRDALGRPLLDGTNTPTTEYDPTVFTDDDGQAYLIVGGPRWAYGEGAGYFMARLADDRVSLAEPLRRVPLDVDADDKSFLHKHGGTYYLSWASSYAVSDCVYGPYRYVGNVGASEDHGSFFSWHGQDFFAFTVFDPTVHRRGAGTCYVHYTSDGRMHVDPLIVEYGAGRYRAEWNRIFACWYMDLAGAEKTEHEQCGFEVSHVRDGGFLRFPHVLGMKENSGLCLFANVRSKTTVEVREGTREGELLGSCVLEPSAFPGWQGYRTETLELANSAGEHDLCFVFHGEGEELLRLRWFKLF